MLKDWLTAAETAKYLGIEPTTLSNWRTRGEGPKYSKLHEKCVLYYVHDVTAFKAHWRKGSHGGRKPVKR